MAGISRTIARDIRSQFVVGFKSNNPQPGGNYRNVRCGGYRSNFGTANGSNPQRIHSQPNFPALEQ